jgi:hypothetical protein
MTDAPVSGGLALLIQEKRDAKATKVVLWLIAANTTARRCRACDTLIERDDDQRWADKAGGVDCGALGFRQKGLRVPHRPDTYSPDRVRAMGKLRDERKRVSGLAGVKECSEETWVRVVVLFEARVDALRKGNH